MMIRVVIGWLNKKERPKFLVNGPEQTTIIDIYIGGVGGFAAISAF